MTREKNITYVCPNKNHPKTARRYKFEPVPLCPICRCQMIKKEVNIKTSKYKKSKILKEITYTKYKIK